MGARQAERVRGAHPVCPLIVRVRTASRYFPRTYTGASHGVRPARGEPCGAACRDRSAGARPFAITNVDGQSTGNGVSRPQPSSFNRYRTVDNEVDCDFSISPIRLRSQFRKPSMMSQGSVRGPKSGDNVLPDADVVLTKSDASEYEEEFRIVGGITSRRLAYQSRW
jgi:hypothetical protein